MHFRTFLIAAALLALAGCAVNSTPPQVNYAANQHPKP